MHVSVYVVGVRESGECFFSFLIEIQGLEEMKSRSIEGSKVLRNGLLVG